MKPRSAIKTDLFANEQHRKKLDTLGDPLLDRMSCKRFCGLETATNVPDRTRVWTVENRIGASGAQALFDGVSAQLLKQGFIARGGQHFDTVFDAGNTSRDVHADRGYPSAQRDAQENGLRNQIQRKGHRNKPLSECQRRRNRRIGRREMRWFPRVIDLNSVAIIFARRDALETSGYTR